MRLSISKIKLFKNCRRAYWLRYVEGLEPIEKAEPLVVGSNYHARLESLYEGQEYIQDYSRESAMAEAYKKYIYPKFHVKKAEQWLEMQIGDHTLVGIADGIADDGHLVEHKTTSGDIGDAYEYNLQWDEQILAYMLMTGMRKVWYTVIKKPTIRLKKDETQEEFWQRMVDWYDEDTESKVRVMEITRTDEEVEDFRKALETMFYVMNEAEAVSDIRADWVHDLMYRNPSYCNQWGRRCEYSSVCLNYSPDAVYAEFTRKEIKDGAKKDS